MKNVIHWRSHLNSNNISGENGSSRFVSEWNPSSERVRVITVKDNSPGFPFHNILRGGFCTPEPRPTAPTLPGQEWLLLLKSWGGTGQGKRPCFVHLARTHGMLVYYNCTSCFILLFLAFEIHTATCFFPLRLNQLALHNSARNKTKQNKKKDEGKPRALHSRAC